MNAIRGKTRTINLTLFYYTCGCTSITSSSGYSFGVATKIIAMPAITSGTARSIAGSTASASTAILYNSYLMYLFKIIIHCTHKQIESSLYLYSIHPRMSP